MKVPIVSNSAVGVVEGLRVLVGRFVASIAKKGSHRGDREYSQDA